MNARQLWWMQATVWMEARGEPFVGMVAVGHVLLNRVRTSFHGSNMASVCLAPEQFSCWNTDSPTRRALALVDEIDTPSWLAVGRACSEAVDDQIAERDPTKGARHYFNPKIIVPKWWRADYAQQQIGQQLFVVGVP